MNYLDLTLRLTIWLLLTADITVANVAVGLAISLILPSSKVYSGQLKQWLI
ncbi:MAG: cation:proton antiporter, partial [Synechococcaceae cyanobacterium RL_1_2]|nr:cation:proton antiporter [Synechococcaceae cyanobacterium RL_1_2]